MSFDCASLRSGRKNLDNFSGKEYGMENFGNLISVLLEHSQRFTDFWNFHIVISLGVLGFVLTNDSVISKLRVRILLTVVFLFISAYSIFSLSVHQEREVRLWNVLDAQVIATPDEFIPEEVQYIDSLKPTEFGVKAGALLTADLLVILMIWFSTKIKGR
jgi:hypothetical protein